MEVDLSTTLGMHLGQQTLRVYSLVEGSQTELAGIVKVGWRCVAVDGIAVSTLDAFKNAVLQRKADAK